MNAYATELVPMEQHWALKVRTPGGLKLEYRYSTERQARYFAAIFSLGPTRLPPPTKIVPHTRRKTRALQRPARGIKTSPW